MSDRPIQVGDLVVAIKPRGCGCPSSKTPIFVVTEITNADVRCADCNKLMSKPSAKSGEISHQTGKWIGCEMRRLKRIPPLSELEGERTDEDIKEPA